MTVDDAASNNPRAISMVSWERRYRRKATAPRTLLHRSRQTSRGPTSPHLRGNYIFVSAIFPERPNLFLAEVNLSYVVQGNRERHHDSVLRCIQCSRLSVHRPTYGGVFLRDP